MFKTFVVIGAVLIGLVIDVQAKPTTASAKVVPAAWRGGYSYRRSAAPAYATYRSNGYSRSSGGRTSALDYPPGWLPAASRNHQWNKYPNQPFYLRGERRSLGILP
jgi:hypothetical protein